MKHLLDHKCDIYHLKKIQQSLGYGLSEQTKIYYQQEPDEIEILCHFSIHDSTLKLAQKEPQQMLEGRIKLTLPMGTHICLHDKVVSKVSGLKYIAEVPRNIRNHHMVVFLKPDDGVKGAI